MGRTYPTLGCGRSDVPTWCASKEGRTTGVSQTWTSEDDTRNTGLGRASVPTLNGSGVGKGQLTRLVPLSVHKDDRRTGPSLPPSHTRNYPPLPYPCPLIVSETREDLPMGFLRTPISVSGVSTGHGGPDTIHPHTHWTSGRSDRTRDSWGLLCTVTEPHRLGHNSGSPRPTDM